MTGDRSPIAWIYGEEQPQNQLGHWTLAEAQEHAGDLEGAAATFAGVAAGEQFGWSDGWDIGFTYSFAHRRAALLYGQVGNREEAIEHWRAFLATFTDPDPEYRAWVDEGRAGLARLVRERRMAFLKVALFVTVSLICVVVGVRVLGRRVSATVAGTSS